jgi:hypothetical protein
MLIDQGLSFLAASSDDLVDNNALCEIKFPALPASGKYESRRRNRYKRKKKVMK